MKLKRGGSLRTLIFYLRAHKFLPSSVQLLLSTHKEQTGHLRRQIDPLISPYQGFILSSTLIFVIKHLSFYFRVVCSLVFIFVFNSSMNKTKDNLKVYGLSTIAEYNISILGALQAEKFI